MSDMEQVEASEARMNAAREALLSYIEQRKSLERDRYQRLLARVKKAEAEFQKTVAELGE
jgi:hypothetical protein